MINHQHDHELFDFMKKELFTAVVGDILDKKDTLTNFYHRILDPSMVIVGKAMPVFEESYKKQRTFYKKENLSII